VEPKLEIRWDNRAAVSVYVPDITRTWAHLQTKQSEGLTCRFFGKKGQFNLNQIEKFGIEPQLQDSREGSALVLQFQHDNHMHPQALREILQQSLEGFRALLTT